MTFKGEPADRTSSRTVGKKDTPTCYCGDVHWIQGCPFINESARLKDWKPDKAIAKKVEEKIASALEWVKLKIEKIRQQALEEKAIQNLDRKELDSIFAV